MEAIDDPALSPTHFSRRFSLILGNWFRRLSSPAIPNGFFTRAPERPRSIVNHLPHLIMDNSPLTIGSAKTTCHWFHMDDVLQPIDPQSSTINSRYQPEPSTSDSVHPPRKGRLLFTAKNYCAVLCNNLEAIHTTIHSVSLWVDAEGIPHRFLTMHAIRLPGLEYYIRLDRRRAHNQPSVAISSPSEANDEVTLSRELDHLLVGKPVKELSRIIFPVSPTLQDVNMILQAVCESYPHYVLYAVSLALPPHWYLPVLRPFADISPLTRRIVGGVYVVPSPLYRAAGNDERIAIRLRELWDSVGSNWSR
ncbi:uncharacterized protein EI90DRAFT_3970 [Cantharellus anzutake]|uniref:uncharacterized protein n=1 Tax=Cantharellus anzutake TaxID=1750568 RepID=UPI001908118D|nr:uncharacterized protein EI90DRAFT_3970 [Cantharellus anzutake]KAF8343784.1 hypothetical protein EI90DRAFT_3970 [Cantharellus anzutake]